MLLSFKKMGNIYDVQIIKHLIEKTSVADPDPYVSGPPGFGSISHRYGSGSFYHQAKIVKKKP
jgi:hypothetical protein